MQPWLRELFPEDEEDDEGEDFWLWSVKALAKRQFHPLASVVFFSLVLLFVCLLESNEWTQNAVFKSHRPAQVKMGVKSDHRTLPLTELKINDQRWRNVITLLNYYIYFSEVYKYKII